MPDLTAYIWLFAEPIHPDTSRWLVEPYVLREADARAQLAAQGYTLDAAIWELPTGILADEEPAHRDHAIRLGGALHGWLLVYDTPPPEIEADHRAALTLALADEATR